MGVLALRHGPTAGRARRAVGAIARSRLARIGPRSVSAGSGSRVALWRVAEQSRGAPLPQACAPHVCWQAKLACPTAGRQTLVQARMP